MYDAWQCQSQTCIATVSKLMTQPRCASCQEQTSPGTCKQLQGCCIQYTLKLSKRVLAPDQEVAGMHRTMSGNTLAHPSARAFMRFADRKPRAMHTLRWASPSMIARPIYRCMQGTPGGRANTHCVPLFCRSALSLAKAVRSTHPLNKEIQTYRFQKKVRPV